VPRPHDAGPIASALYFLQLVLSVQLERTLFLAAVIDHATSYQSAASAEKYINVMIKDS